MKKVIMLLTNAFLPDPRPYAEAAALARAGYDVKIVCWDRGEALPGKETVDGIDVERIRVASTHGRGVSQIFYLCRVWAGMLKRLPKEKEAIIWCHDLDTLAVGLMAKRFTRQRVVFDSHEVFSKMLGANIAEPFKRLVASLEKTMSRKADLVIVTCPAMEEYYRACGAKNIVVVGNYKDPLLFSIPADVLDRERAALGFRNELVISYIANLGPERILEPLLDVVREDSDVFLIIGGDGAQRAVVEKAARECPRIKYLGHVHARKVPLYTALADLIYYGYDKAAGMAAYCNPNKLFEALAAGKAFVGGSFGQMGEIIKEEKCGIALDDFTIESVKGAVQTMKDPAKLRSFKENAAKAGLNKYTWQVAKDNLIKAIARLNGSY